MTGGLPQLRAPWVLPAAVIVLVLGAMGLVFSHEAQGAMRVWSDSRTYNHCFLILPIALYMVWSRQGRLAGIAPRPAWLALIPLLLLSGAWLAASALGVLELQQFIVVAMALCVILAVLGWAMGRALMAPLLYLFFLVPSGDYLIPTLQDFTAHFAVAGLQLFGVPVFSDGTVIEVPSGTFVVAEACAGLRFLVAAIAFCVFFATEMFDSLYRRLAFIALAVIVPVLANGLRAFGLIGAAEIFGSAAAVEADHVLYGWIFFSLVLLMLIAIGWWMSDRKALLPPAPVPASGPVAASRLLAAGCAGLLLAAAGPLAAHALMSRSGQVALPQTGLAVSRPWQLQAPEDSAWQPVLKGPDRLFHDRFAAGDNQVERVLALYVPSGTSDNLIRSDNRVAQPDDWHPVSRGSRQVVLDGMPVLINADSVSNGAERRLIWSFYVVGGQPLSGVWRAKLAQAVGLLRGDPCLDGFIAVSTPDGAGANAVLADFLSRTRGMKGYFCPD